MPGAKGAVSEAVESKRVQEMPLNGRNTMNLLALTPGVLAPVGRSNPTSWTSILAGQAISGPIPHQSFASTQQWNLSVDRQFAGDLLVEAGYNGSSSSHLPTTQSYDERARQ